ncbi:hypothetical protein ROZALSC1DRAFT_27332 [Rozella allomycis CSF55]|uniref:Uncharacterized protein n=1 Tax=Rozella allomycis (strain CSF55) TaxID=988480 RepID=A0A4V1J0E3_ROZAC|nr:hypothetical protein ROZALSC1DRAFT_27332 [Rozella allomycis CSF55]
MLSASALAAPAGTVVSSTSSKATIVPHTAFTTPPGSTTLINKPVYHDGSWEPINYSAHGAASSVRQQNTASHVPDRKENANTNLNDQNNIATQTDRKGGKWNDRFDALKGKYDQLVIKGQGLFQRVSERIKSKTDKSKNEKTDDLQKKGFISRHPALVGALGGGALVGGAVLVDKSIPDDHKPVELSDSEDKLKKYAPEWEKPEESNSIPSGSNTGKPTIPEGITTESDSFEYF